MQVMEPSTWHTSATAPEMPWPEDKELATDDDRHDILEHELQAAGRAAIQGVVPGDVEAVAAAAQQRGPETEAEAHLLPDAPLRFPRQAGRT